MYLQAKQIWERKEKAKGVIAQKFNYSKSEDSYAYRAFSQGFDAGYEYLAKEIEKNKE